MACTNRHISLRNKSYYFFSSTHFRYFYNYTHFFYKSQHNYLMYVRYKLKVLPKPFQKLTVSKNSPPTAESLVAVLRQRNTLCSTKHRNVFRRKSSQEVPCRCLSTAKTQNQFLKQNFYVLNQLMLSQITKLSR